MADEPKSRYSNTWSGDEFLGEIQRVLIERGLTPPEWPSRTPTERDFAIESCAGWCEDRLREIAALKAELASVRSERPFTLPPEANELAAMARDARRYREVRRDPTMLLHLSNNDFDAAVDERLHERNSGEETK